MSVGSTQGNCLHFYLQPHSPTENGCCCSVIRYKISLPMREIYNPVAQNHLLPCVAHANDAGTQLEYQIVQQRALPEEMRPREGGLAKLCPDRRHYPGI